MPIGDIQYTGRKGTTALDTLHRHIDACLAAKGWFIGLGDYIDFASPSNRQRLKGAALYDTADQVISDKAADLTQELFDVALRPTVGRWLGLLEGHHWSPLTTGETTDQMLCRLLQTTFLGTSAIVRLVFQCREMRGNLTLWAHHGSGGGMKCAAMLNKLENIAPYWGGVDVFLVAHATKLATAPINRVTPRWAGRGRPELIHRKIYFVACGGFAKAYTGGDTVGATPRGGYAEQRMLNPAVLGAPTIRIVPRIRDGVWSPDVSVEV